MATVTLICRGVRLGGKDQLVLTFINAEGEAVNFLDRNTKMGHGIQFCPGGVYNIEETQPGRFQMGKAKYLRDHVNDAESEEWAAASRAARQELELIRTARKRAARDPLDKHIEALRWAYSRLPAAQRLGFEIWLLSRLRKN